MLSVIYREVRPDERLAPYLKCLWYMERDYAVATAPETIWPDGKVELLFHFGELYDSPQGRLPHAFVIGPLTRYLPLRSAGKVRLVGARFLPWGFCPLFGAPMAKLRDQVVPFEGMVGTEARELTTQLAETDCPGGVARLEEYLLKRLRPLHPEVVAAARAILESRGAVSMQELEPLTGLSLRQLERAFSQWVGITPKQLGTTCRFDSARRAIHANPEVDLMDVAFRLGYYDYPHFAKNFQRYFGLTPVDFRAFVLQQRAAMRGKSDVAFLQARKP